MKLFALLVTGEGIVFNLFLFYDHIPFQYRLWQEDLASGKPYIDLWTGVESSIDDRIVSRSWTDWHEELLWMGSYFTVGVWICLYMINAPRFEKKSKTK